MTTFRCAPADASSSGSGSTHRARSPRGETRTVDIHCHVHTESAAEMAASAFSPDKEPALHYATEHSNRVNQLQMADLQPKLTVLSERIADMDQMGIDIQAISPSPFQFYYYTEAEIGRSRRSRMIRRLSKSWTARWSWRKSIFAACRSDERPLAGNSRAP